MKVKYKEFEVKKFKRKLGSCSHDGALKFDWRIVMFPKKVIDYIIVHELSHIRYFNHSKHFWNFVREFCPDFVAQKQWIKKNM